MKVKELIECLAKFDPEWEVLVENGNYSFNINMVEEDEVRKNTVSLSPY